MINVKYFIILISLCTLPVLSGMENKQIQSLQNDFIKGSYLERLPAELRAELFKFGVNWEDPSMMKIHKWQDVQPFAGRIVAYIADHYSGKEYILNTNNMAKYGFVEHTPSFYLSANGTAYTLHQLVAHRAEGSWCESFVLIKTSTQKNIFVRLASTEEIEHIRHAISRDKAIFNRFIYKKEMFSILNTHLVMLKLK